MNKFNSLAKFIIKNVGGEKNINGLMHCMTRLRFVLKDEHKADTEALKNHDEILSVVNGNGQYQVVIGTHVKEVYNAIMEETSLTNNNDDKNEKQSTSFLDMLAKIFTPILGILGATGMVKGILVLLTTIGILSKDSGTYQLLYVVGDSVIYFLPVFLGYTTAKYFKSNLLVGIAIGLCLIHPNVLAMMGKEPLYILFDGSMIQSKVFTTFLSIPVLLMNYTSSSIPVIISIYFASKIEKLATKIIPNVVQMFLVPATTLVIVVPLTFIVIGPIATWAGNILSQLTLAIYNISPIISGAVIGGIWQFCIMFGLHRSFTPITINNIAVYGYDMVFAARFAFPIVMTAVMLALTLKAKSAKDKAASFPAFISALFGITEPGMYGLVMSNLRLMIIISLSTGLCGALMGFFKAKFYVLGGGGIFVLPSYLNPEGLDLASYGAIIALLIGFVSAFILTFMFGFKAQKKDEVLTNTNEPINSIMKQEIIASPIKGKIIPLSEINDEVFADAIMGKGCAIIPEEGKVYAPADGVVTALFPTGHAVGVTTTSGVEILIHIGINTVKLNGEFFKIHIKKGEPIKKDDLLIEFDLEEIKKQGFDLTTPIVIINTKNYLDVLPLDINHCEVGEDLLSIVI